MLLIMTSSGDELFRGINIASTPKIRDLSFLRLSAVAHISRVNCDEITGRGPRQPIYEIFSIEHRFQQFKFRPSGSLGLSSPLYGSVRVLLQHERFLYPLVYHATVTDGHRLAACRNKHYKHNF